MLDGTAVDDLNDVISSMLGSLHDCFRQDIPGQLMSHDHCANCISDRLQLGNCAKSSDKPV